MTSRQIIGEGPTLEDALKSAAQELGVDNLRSLRWDFEREHFRGGAWSVRVLAHTLPEEELAALQANAETSDEAHQWLQALLGWFHNDGADIVNRRRGDQLVLSIEGARDGKLFIGRDGKNLPAFQHLFDKAMAKSVGGDVRVLLDVDGYLGDREGRIEYATREAIDEVKRTGEPARLREMNSYERRLVHTVVKEAGLVSRSVGRPGGGGLKGIEISLASSEDTD